MPKNLHAILQEPYPTLFAETEKMLWERQGKSGKPRQYQSETLRFAIDLTHRYLTREREALAKDVDILNFGSKGQ